MKIEKKFFSISFSEMLILTLFILLFVNVLAFLAALITGISYLTILRTGWFLLVVYPIAHGVIQASMDRNGMLIISGYDDFQAFKKELKTISHRISYEQTDKHDKVFKFNRSTRLGRLINLLFREDFTMVRRNGTVEIYGKRNTLKRIERRYKLLHQDEDS